MNNFGIFQVTSSPNPPSNMGRYNHPVGHKIVTITPKQKQQHSQIHQIKHIPQVDSLNYIFT